LSLYTPVNLSGDFTLDVEALAHSGSSEGLAIELEGLGPHPNFLVTFGGYTFRDETIVNSSFTHASPWKARFNSRLDPLPIRIQRNGHIMKITVNGITSYAQRMPDHKTFGRIVFYLNQTERNSDLKLYSVKLTTGKPGDEEDEGEPGTPPVDPPDPKPGDDDDGNKTQKPPPPPPQPPPKPKPDVLKRLGDIERAIQTDKNKLGYFRGPYGSAQYESRAKRDLEALCKELRISIVKSGSRPNGCEHHRRIDVGPFFVCFHEDERKLYYWKKPWE
jgi:hypothetical protein